MDVLYPLSWFIVGIVCAFACARIAMGKGRGAVLWGLLGFFFTIIPLIVIAVLPPATAAGAAPGAGAETE